MTRGIVRYRSPDEDSARWDDFRFRAGDIIISARSKHGTTWTQMICALLILQTSQLPAPLDALSPWLDWLGEPREDVFARLEAQQHRRFIKTHTPLDGIPRHPLVTYVVVARHPLDAAVSLYHQGDNIDRERVRQLTGQSQQPASANRRPSLHDWLAAWINWDADPQNDLDSMPGVMRHLAGAWARRTKPTTILVHYHDLSTDLDASMRALATRLGIAVPEHAWPELVRAATFEQMRSRAQELAPDTRGVFEDPSRFFREGVSGAGRRHLSPSELGHYMTKANKMVPPDLLKWLHRPS